MEEVISRLHPDQSWFWSTHGGPECDLLLMIGSKRYGFEFKLSDAPKITSSMKQSLDILELERLFVVYPGPVAWQTAERISVLPLREIREASCVRGL